MTRNLLRTLLASVLLFSSFLVTPLPAEAHTYQSACPAMTDSITRLYKAFFDREPDSSGFKHWVSVYESGDASLAEIAQTFATDEEFINRFLDNRQYVDWLYEEVLGPEYSPERDQYWVDVLERGYPRGAVALAFTESREYVDKTDTAKPLAGFLRWYPKGTHWYCNVGAVPQKVKSLQGELYADYYFHNRSDTPDSIRLWTLDADGTNAILMVDNTLQPGHTDYDWDGSFYGNGQYGEAVDVRVGDQTDWIVVFYPRNIGPERLGWQLT